MSAQRKRTKLLELRAIDKSSSSHDNTGKAEVNSAAEMDIKIEDFINIRQNEIKSLETAVANSISMVGKQAFQVLPKRLRRRGASHFPSRLPFGLRRYARYDVIKSKKKARKNKSTKIFQDRRLLSHLWHVKRMVMLNIWGCRIADRPTEKSRLSLYRAFKYGCVLYDASYFHVLVVKEFTSSGKFSSLLDPFIQGPTDKPCGRQFIYKPEMYPLGLICDFEFLVLNGALILWIHPAALSEVEQVFRDCHIEFDVAKVATFKIFGPQSLTALNSVLPGISENRSTDFFMHKLVDNPDSIAHLDSPALKEEFLQNLNQNSASNDPIALLTKGDDHVSITVNISKKAKSLWNNLVIKCRRVAGLRALLSQHFEKSRNVFPFDYVETTSYKDWSNNHLATVNSEKAKYPPSKRSIKRNALEIPLNEFSFDTCLMPSDSSYWVIRSKKVLRLYLTYCQREAAEELAYIGKGSIARGCLIYSVDSFISLTSESVMQCFDLILNKRRPFSDLLRLSDDSKAIGYVSTADLELNSARSKGLALISSIPLRKMINNVVTCNGFSNLVIIHCPRTKNFGIATAKILALPE